MEYGCPVWHGGLTVKQSSSLESVQKRALRIILGNQFSSYDDALNICNLTSLSEPKGKFVSIFHEKKNTFENQPVSRISPPSPTKEIIEKPQKVN